jgi:hypothetical protein
MKHRNFVAKNLNKFNKSVKMRNKKTDYYRKGKSKWMLSQQPMY